MRKILIVNDAELPYQFIGMVIDDYLNDYEDDTFCMGMVIDYQDKLYNITIKYLKRYVEFRFTKYLEEDKSGKLESSNT